MKGLLCYPEMLDNSDASRVLTNSNVGHLIAYQVCAFFFFFSCVQPVRLPVSFDVNIRCFISDERSRVPSD